jgi:hypothetical protein
MYDQWSRRCLTLPFVDPNGGLGGASRKRLHRVVRPLVNITAGGGFL